MKIVRSLLKKIIRFFYYERVVLYGYDLTKQHKYESKTGMKLCNASMEDIDLLFHDKMNTDITTIKYDLWKEKISNGSWKGYLIKNGQEIVAQAFYSIEDIFFGGTKWVELTLPEGSAYGFKLFARPDYRGKGLGQAITSFRLNSAKNQGVKKFYTIILSHNKVSRHNEEKIGGYYIGSVLFIKCRYFNWVLLSPGIIIEGLKKKQISVFKSN